MPEGGRPASPRPAGLARACVDVKQLSTASRSKSEPLSKSQCPRGRIPRPAGLGRPAGPTWKPLTLGLGMEVKLNRLTCLHLTPTAVPARNRPWKPINREPISLVTHTIGALLSLLHLLE